MIMHLINREMINTQNAFDSSSSLSLAQTKKAENRAGRTDIPGEIEITRTLCLAGVLLMNILAAC